MGRYCKAYPAERLRAFPGWIEKNWKSSKGTEVAESTTEMAEEQNHFYIQENYVVTADIFLDEKVVFDQVTDEWRSFCRDILDFHSPFDKEAAAPQENAASVSN